MKFIILLLASMCYAGEEVTLPYGLIMQVRVTYLPRAVNYSDFNGNKQSPEELEFIRNDMKNMIGLVELFEQRIIVPNPVGGSYYSANSGSGPRQFWSLSFTDIHKDKDVEYVDIRRCDISYDKIDNWPGMSFIRDNTDSFYPLMRLIINAKDRATLYSITGSYLNTIELTLVENLKVPLNPR